MSANEGPDWRGLNEEELTEYVDEVSADFKLTPDQSRHLLSRLRFKLGFWPGRQPRTKEESERIRQLARDEREQAVRKGSGLTARLFFDATKWPKKLKPIDLKRLKRSRRWRGKKPFKALAHDLRLDLDEYRWASGCLETGYGHWIVPIAEQKPYEGVWWYCEEIEKYLANAQNQVKSGEPEFAARSSFRAGQLQAELEMRFAHNAYFEKQRAITEAQSAAARSRRSQTDEIRRERVRHYLLMGDKPTMAAENAATDLGVSLSTIRRAFPDELLPEGPHDF